MHTVQIKHEAKQYQERNGNSLAVDGSGRWINISGHLKQADALYCDKRTGRTQIYDQFYRLFTLSIIPNNGMKGKRESLPCNIYAVQQDTQLASMSQFYSALILARHVSDLTGPSSGAFFLQALFADFCMW